MADRLNKDTINQQVSENPYLGMPKEQLAEEKRKIQALIQQERRKAIIPAINESMSGIGDIFLQSGGIKPPESKTSDINELIMKERVKRMIEGDPLAKKRAEIELQAEMDKSNPAKQADLKIKERILKGMEEGGARIFRDVLTGEEVDEQTALIGMQQGKQYKVFLRSQTRSGAKESEIAGPPKRTENENDFLSQAPQAIKDLESIITQLTSDFQAPWGGFARVSSRNRVLVPEQKLRKLQEPYTRVLKNLLFGPAGKALTGTEREVLEKAAEATGKSPEEWERDMIAALDVVKNKHKMLTTGQIPTMTVQPGESQTVPTTAGQSKVGKYIIVE